MPQTFQSYNSDFWGHVMSSVAPLWKYGASKIIGSWPWPFGVTWRYWSRRVVTIWFAVGHFLWVAHCDHASILRRYRDKCTKHQFTHLL